MSIGPVYVHQCIDLIGALSEFIVDENESLEDRFSAKQRLYAVLWAAQKAMKDLPTFEGETEWVNEHGTST